MKKIQKMAPDLTPAQCRAARSLLDWTQGDLAMASMVTVSAIKNFEVGRSKLLRVSRKSIVEALESAGIEFLDTEGNIGVTLGKASAA